MQGNNALSCTKDLDTPESAKHNSTKIRGQD